MTPAELSWTVLSAVRRAVAADELRVAVPEKVVVQRPPRPGCGDYATNVALQLAGPAGRTAQEVAEILAVRLAKEPGIAQVEIAGGGFLNITLSARAYADVVRQVREQGPDYGRGDGLAGEAVTVVPEPPHAVRAALVADVVNGLLRAAGAGPGGRREPLRVAEPADPTAPVVAANGTASVGGHGTASVGGHGRASVGVHDPAPAGGGDAVAVAVAVPVPVPVSPAPVAAGATEPGRVRVPAFGPPARHAAPAPDAVPQTLAPAPEPDTRDAAPAPDAVPQTPASDARHAAPASDAAPQTLAPAPEPDTRPAAPAPDAVPQTPGPDARHPAPAPDAAPRPPAPAPPAPAAPGRPVLDADATRWSLLRPPAEDVPRADSALLEQRESNPLFRVRYAHARTRALLRNAHDLGVRVDAAARDPYRHPAETELLGLIADFPRVVETAARRRAPDRLARHLERLADAFLRFQDECPALPKGDEKPSAVHAARVRLADATGIVLADGLHLLGISAPDHL